MAREVVLYITASLDGFIADTDGGVGWLSGAEGEDYGFAALMESVDTVLQGSRTYLKTLDLVDYDPYAGKTNYVFTSRKVLPVIGSPILVAEEPVAFVSALKRRPGGRIWCIGGGVLASGLLSEGLIDEIDLFIQPIVLGDGVPLWVPPMTTRSLTLIEARSWPGDLVQVRYGLQARV